MKTLDITNETETNSVQWKYRFNGVDFYYKITSLEGHIKITQSNDGVNFKDVIYFERKADGAIFITTAECSSTTVGQTGVMGDSGNMGLLTVFGTENTSTGFGVNQAGYLRLRGSGNNLAGMILGLSVNKPIIIGRGNQKDVGIPTGGIAEYPDNASALSEGLTPGDLYRTGDILKIVH